MSEKATPDEKKSCLKYHLNSVLSIIYQPAGISSNTTFSAYADRIFSTLSSSGPSFFKRPE
jgi:hypothetical protein